MLTSVSLVWKWVNSMAVPKLRFKDSEGREFPEWKKKKLKDILNEYKEYSLKNGTYEHVSLTVEGIVPKSERYERDYLVRDTEKKYRITHLNDICYNPANLKFGVICRNKYGDGIFSPIYITFIVKEKMLPEFVEMQITRSDFINRALKYQQGTVFERMAVSPEDLLNMDTFVPSISEQQKIADFLTSYDTMIDTQTKRVEAMKARKKGLLQKIFSQEIRFKDDEGKEFPEWEEKKVEDLALNIFGGGTPSTKNTEFYSGNIPWISSSDLEDDNVSYLSITRFITEEALNSSATKLIPANSVLIVSRVGVGKVAINQIPLCTSQDFMNLVVNEENSSLFVAYFMMHLMVRKKNSVQGTAIKGIPSADIKKYDILVPALPEQQKIADFLAAVDKQIEVEEKRLDTMKTIKKGLLQQMFV